MGNPLRGDDGIGPRVAKIVRKNGTGWDAIDAGLVPENFTGIIRRKKPKVLVLVDASDMGLQPGEARIIPPERVGVMHFSTHSIPLSVFISVMGECAGKTYLLGIQVDPKKTVLGEELSPEAEKWAEETASTLILWGPQNFRNL